MVASVQIGAGITVGAGVNIGPFPVHALVLNLDANNPASYNGSGTTWTDISGFNNNVSMVNSGSITWNSGTPSYFSTGPNGYFNSPGNATIPTGNTLYTFNIWVSSPGQGSWGSNGILSVGGFEVSNQSNAFRVSGYPYLDNYWWANDFSTYTDAPSTGWFLATVTYDGINRNIYVNGVLQGSSPSSGHNVTSTNVNIAATWTGSSETLYGDIGAAQIYNYALSQTVITNYFNATRGTYGF